MYLLYQNANSVGVKLCLISFHYLSEEDMISSTAFHHSSYLQFVFSLFCTWSFLLVTHNSINLVKVPAGGFVDVIYYIFPSISLISAFILIISILPISLDLTCWPSSSCWRQQFKLLLFQPFFFSKICICGYTFSQTIAFSCISRCLYAVFLLSFSSKYLKFKKHCDIFFNTLFESELIYM